MGQTLRERAAARKTVETPTAPEPPEYVATMTLARLSAVVREAIAAQHTPAPEYRSDIDEARRLDIGVSTLRRMATDGCPHVYCGDRRRWRAADVDAWLRSRGAR